MSVFYRRFFCGFLALFLMGAGPVDVAAYQKVTFQNKRTPVQDSLIRPTAKRPSPVTDKVYRQDRARDAMRSGRIVSLSVIRKRIRQSFPGKIVDVRLLEPKNKNLPYIYMVKVLRKDGKLLMLRINAANAKIVSVKGNG